MRKREMPWWAAATITFGACGGDGGEGVDDAVAAAQAMSRAICDKLVECVPGVVEAQWDDLADCEAFYDDSEFIEEELAELDELAQEACLERIVPALKCATRSFERASCAQFEDADFCTRELEDAAEFCGTSMAAPLGL